MRSRSTEYGLNNRNLPQSRQAALRRLDPSVAHLVALDRPARLGFCQRMAKRTRPKAAKASRKPTQPTPSSITSRRADARSVLASPAAPARKELGPERLQLAPAAVDRFRRGMESLQRHQ